MSRSALPFDMPLQCGVTLQIIFGMRAALLRVVRLGIALVYKLCE